MADDNGATGVLAPLRREVFGRRVVFDVSRASARRILARELSLYPPGSGKRPIDLTVRVVDEQSFGQDVRKSPQHWDLEDGFAGAFGRISVRYVAGERGLTRIDVALGAPHSAVKKTAWRMAHLQYTALDEKIGQLIHELALMPSVYFDVDRFVVHAAAVKSPKGSIVLIGGTGGVGKTSLELELCGARGFKFVADDMCVVQADGHVWPNLGFPKIYAYNVRGETDIRRRVFRGRGPLDRLSWRLHSLRGERYVRRRVSPEVLYGGYSATGGTLSRYVLLGRHRKPSIDRHPLSAEEAADMTIAVMQYEHSAFIQHIHWHEVNRGLSRQRPALVYREVMEQWRRAAVLAFTGVACEVILVPSAMDHDRFKAKVASLLAEY
jgi:hypothetical protein